LQQAVEESANLTDTNYISLSKATDPFKLERTRRVIQSAGRMRKQTAFVALATKLQRAPLKTM